MNSKQAKRIRKAIREGGVDPKEKEYQPLSQKNKTVRLALDCGRAKYKRFKRYVLSLSPLPVE